MVGEGRLVFLKGNIVVIRLETSPLVLSNRCLMDKDVLFFNKKLKSVVSFDGLMLWSIVTLCIPYYSRQESATSDVPEAQIFSSAQVSLWNTMYCK